MTKSYSVTITHPTGFYKSGPYTIEVCPNKDGSRYVKGGGQFGCSRDYPTKDDKAALQAFFSEHGCTIDSIKKAK